MENMFESIKALLNKTLKYANTNIELFKLSAIDRLSDLFSTIVIRLLFVLLCFMFLIFLSVGLALWLGEILGKNYLGFLGVAIFYFVLGAVLFSFCKGYMKRKLKDNAIFHLLNDKE